LVALILVHCCYLLVDPKCLFCAWLIIVQVV
jgi:hypothetical protein